jgi:hypothetical protein
MTSEILVILSPHVTAADREGVVRLAPPTQSISERVFIAQAGDVVAAQLRALPGVHQVFTGGEGAGTLPPLSDSEALFAQAWMSSKAQKKQRLGEGLDWDTPPMTPPDPKFPK